jgi:hypothetical protein
VGKGCLGCQIGCEGRGEVVNGTSTGEKYCNEENCVPPCCALYAQWLLHSLMMMFFVCDSSALVRA